MSVRARKSCCCDLIALLAIVISLIVCLCPCPAFARPPIDETDASVLSDKVEFLSGEGFHFEAVNQYRELKEPIPQGVKLAAARSYWALGLTDSARQIWQEMEGKPDLVPQERARFLLGRAILEHQEGNNQEAVRLAQEAIHITAKSQLRSQSLLLLAEALRGLGANEEARRNYEAVVSEGSPELADEARLSMAHMLEDKGLLDQSRKILLAIDRKSNHSAEALKALIDIDTKRQDYASLKLWLNELESVSNGASFEKPRYHYLKIVSELAEANIDEAKESLKAFGNRFPAENSWVVLAKAALSAAEASKTTGPTRKSDGVVPEL